ncbi:MAG: hypothetical protein JXB17_01575 [Bacteroidales bacterium]|nr:hypothetical protein [Bacteroidales bacterium]
MKKIVYLMALLISTICYAQEYEEEVHMDEEENDEIMTLFKSNTNGGFGGVSIIYSEINGQDGIFLGGRGGWIIGHGLSIGFGGCGYFNSTDFDTAGIRNSLAGGHGGMYIEPILFPRFPVHLCLPVFVGAGGISYIEYDNDRPYSDDPGNIIESDGYFIAEPGVELEFNMLKHFRMTAGVYYTYTSKIQLDNVKGDPLDNLKYGITFKFGKF